MRYLTALDVFVTYAETASWRIMTTYHTTMHANSNIRLPECFDPTLRVAARSLGDSEAGRGHETDLLTPGATLQSFAAVRQRGQESLNGLPYTYLDFDQATLQATVTTDPDRQQRDSCGQLVTSLQVSPQGELAFAGDNPSASIIVREPTGAVWGLRPRHSTSAQLAEGSNVILLHAQTSNDPYVHPSSARLREAFRLLGNTIDLTDPMAAGVIAASMFDDETAAQAEALLALVVTVNTDARELSRQRLVLPVAGLGALLASATCILCLSTPPQSVVAQNVLPTHGTNTYYVANASSAAAEIVAARKTRQSIEDIRNVAGAVTGISFFGMVGAGIRLHRARTEAARAFRRRRLRVPIQRAPEHDTATPPSTLITRLSPEESKRIGNRSTAYMPGSIASNSGKRWEATLYRS